MQIISIDNYGIELMQVISNINKKQLALIVNTITKTLLSGNKIILIGNGGSAANASHISCDINRIIETYNLKSMAFSLSDNISNLTRISNDVSYEMVYSNQLKHFSRNGDFVIALSTSGSSINIMRAIEYLNKNKINTLLITGLRCMLKPAQSVGVLKLHSSNTQILEDLQTILFHHIVITIESEFERKSDKELEILRESYIDSNIFQV